MRHVPLGVPLRRREGGVKTRSPDRRPTVVIAGAGFAGLRAAKALRGDDVQVVLVDRTNYHLFQPLLYQVASAYLDPGQIAQPVRAILRGQRNIRFLMAEISGVDLRARRVHTTQGDVPYDYLLLATGSETDYRGLESVRRLGFGLKSLTDAIAIRNHILTCFERAVLASRPAERRALLTFCVAGGGATGIEMAGALAELIRHVLARDFPEVRREEYGVILLEGADRLLGGTPPSLGAAAHRALERREIEVRYGAQVVDYDGSRALLKDGGVVATCTLIWTAGVQGSSLAQTLDASRDPRGRVLVTPTLQLGAHPEVFVLGDLAHVEGTAGHPMVAPAAMQMAVSAARSIRRLRRGLPAAVFTYRSPGQLATVGRNAAVAHVWGMRFSGFVAWVLWLVIHLIGLIGFRSRAVVLLSWALDYFFNERAVRVITGEPGPALRESMKKET